MKVLVYTCLFPNHLQPNHSVFIKHRMQHFAKLDGCEIKVVNPVPFCPSWSFLEKWYPFARLRREEILEGIEVYHPRYALIPKISMALHGISLYLSSLNLVRRIEKDFPFDLIDGHYIYPDGFAAVLLGRALGKPVVLSARGTDINQFGGFRSIKPMIRHTLDRAAHVISVSQALKDRMAEIGVSDEKISVIPNGIDLNHFYVEDRVEARRRLGVSEDAKVILSVGSLIPLKGHDVILGAFQELVRKVKGLHLYVVGEGPERGILERKAREINLASSVSFVGQQPNRELRNWYNAADVFCLASSREGWPNVIMEALACGTPVVATNIGGAPEILTTPEVGILVERNPNAIAEGLLLALNRNWDRSRIHRHVSQRTWHQVAEEVKAVFDLTLLQWARKSEPAE
ncbi:MAG: glycosyltransferase family 4 protein [Desulfatiglandales bacterium]